MKPETQPWQVDDEKVQLLAGASAIGTLPPESVGIIRRLAQDLLNAKSLIAAHAPQQWIPVSERAPEIGQEVLVHIAGDILTTRLERVWCDGGRRPFEAETDQTRFATHWMPLPAPPVPDAPGKQSDKGYMPTWEIEYDSAGYPHKVKYAEAAPRVPQGEEKQP